MAEVTDSDIAVAGGGAVAAATALAAAAAGLRVCHLAPPAPPAAAAGGRHYALSRRSVRFLHRLGVAPALLPVERFMLYAGAGARPLRLADGGAPLCHMAEEAALQDALAQRLQQAAVATIRADSVVWKKSDDDAVQLEADGVSHRTALLAVADGSRSPLAQQLGVAARVVDFHQQAVVAEVSTAALDGCTAAQWFADNDIAALLPAGGGRFSLVWSTAAAPAPAALADALRQRTGLADIRVRADSQRRFPLKSVTRALRVLPRTALLGDAAAVVHPLAGQGLNLGLADAETLVQCICRRRADTLALGLAAYSSARSRRCSALQHITQFLLRRHGCHAALFRLARLPLLARGAVAFANA